MFVRVDSVTDETIYRPSKPDTAMLCMFETATIDLEIEPDRCRRMCELLHTSLVVQKMHGRAGRPKNNGVLEE